MEKNDLTHPTVYQTSTTDTSPQQQSSSSTNHSSPNKKFKCIQATEKCSVDSECEFKNLYHFHCTQFNNRCHFATVHGYEMDQHNDQFIHDFILHQNNINSFDKNIDCRLKGCRNNLVRTYFFEAFQLLNREPI